MKEKEYDLKRSAEGIGQLYPILLDKEGNPVDGLHRLKDVKDWKTEILPQIDTMKKFLTARLVANFHRRTLPPEEMKELLNRLAEEYVKEGIKVGDLSALIARGTGISRTTVIKYLDKKHLDKFQSERSKIKGARLNQLNRGGKIKLESEKDERIEPFLSPKRMKKFREEMARVKEKTDKILYSEEGKEKTKLIMNLYAHWTLLDALGSAYCPRCGKSSEFLKWTCCKPFTGVPEAEQIIRKEIEKKEKKRR